MESKGSVVEEEIGPGSTVRLQLEEEQLHGTEGVAVAPAPRDQPQKSRSEGGRKVVSSHAHTFGIKPVYQHLASTLPMYVSRFQSPCIWD